MATIEEKAKAYDEKLDVARHIYADPSVKDEDKYYIEVIFPELAESEDERIRKALKEYFINSFQNNGVAAILGVHIKDILAWLEKQAEQSKKHDVCDTCDEKDSCISPCCVKLVEEQGGQKQSYIDMSLVDAVRFCVADNLAHKSTDDNGNTISFGVYIDNTIAQKLTNELFDIFQKSVEWSEEDEKMLKRVIDFIPQCMTAHGYNEYINWLESLKERVQLQPHKQWKPSG